MFGVLEASQFEAIAMEEPLRWHSFKLSFLYFPYCLAFVGCHWRCFHPHLPFSFSTCHVFQLHFQGHPTANGIAVLNSFPGHIVMCVEVEVQHL